jgi:low affinity Fe/Cu permease
VFVFNNDVLPNFLASYSSSVLLFYGAIVYVIASAFRSAMVRPTWQVYIFSAPFTEEILMICQCIYIYRVKKKYTK